MRNVRERSLSVFPAGSNGEFNLPPESSIVISRGNGCELWDAQGRRYLDFSMGWGSVLVGHARTEVVEAVTRRAPLGSNFSYVTEDSLQLGEELIRTSPACDRVRFCASGTEATMYCLRLARAYTKRWKVLKFEGAYHGAIGAGVISPVRKDRLHRDLQAGPFVQGGLLDLAGGGSMRRPPARRENPTARRADGLEIRPQVPQEEGLADNRREAPPLRFEDGEDRAIDRLGLLARTRHLGGRLAEEEELPDLGAFHPTEDDSAAVRLDRLGGGMGRHGNPLTGAGSWAPITSTRRTL